MVVLWYCGTVAPDCVTLGSTFSVSVDTFSPRPPHHHLWKWPRRKAIQFIRRCLTYARKSGSQAVLSRMRLTLHATRQTPDGASRLVQAMPAWLVKTRRAPSRHCRDATVHVHDNEYTPPPSLVMWRWFSLTFSLSLTGRPPLLLIFLGFSCRLRSLTVQRCGSR